MYVKNIRSGLCSRAQPNAFTFLRFGTQVHAMLSNIDVLLKSVNMIGCTLVMQSV